MDDRIDPNSRTFSFFQILCGPCSGQQRRRRVYLNTVAIIAAAGCTPAPKAVLPSNVIDNAIRSVISRPSDSEIAYSGISDFKKRNHNCCIFLKSEFSKDNPYYGNNSRLIIVYKRYKTGDGYYNSPYYQLELQLDNYGKSFDRSGLSIPVERYHRNIDAR